MTSFIVTIVLLLVALMLVVVRKTYYSTPVIELRRRARQNDRTASQLYRAVAYGSSLRALLWLLITVSGAASFVVLSRVAPVWLSLLVVIVSLWAAFSWLPASHTTPLGVRLTLLLNPIIVWLLTYLHPILSRGARLVEKAYSLPAHTGLFERDDLVDLIDRQYNQRDSRFTTEELDIAKRALQFDNHKVADVMTPRTKLPSVLTTDTVGPVLIDELHKLAQDIVLVRETKKGPVIGWLEYKQLGIKSSGHVADIMHDTVYYVHEDDSLSEALHIFFVTNHPLFVVVNRAEDCLGVITVETILEQLLGHVPGDDFDQYSDLQAVAHRYENVKAASESDESEPEVVE